MKRVIVVGAQGQDGRLLVSQLAAQGHAVCAIGRTQTTYHGTDELGPIDVLATDTWPALVRALAPDEVYWLAAVHQASQGPAPLASDALQAASRALHVEAPERCLGALAVDAPRARFFYAASTHVFANRPSGLVNERSPMAPEGAYGESKAAGVERVRAWRSRGLFACAGFLHTHESPLRGPNFLSQRVARGLWDVKRGQASEVVLGDLAAEGDWGWADDYVRAMQLVLGHPEPEDFVIATGERRTVRDWVRIGCDRLGLDPACVREDPSLLARRMEPLRPDPTRLRETLGWRPSITFEQLVLRLVDAARPRPD